MSDITYISNLPSPSDFVKLRQETEWGDITLDQASRALDHSLCGITAYEGSSAIAMARVIGDGVLNLYIQDMIVADPYRGKRYGSQLMMALITSLQKNYPAHCTIGLMAAKGKAEFYTQFAFQTRPSHINDAGMTASLGDLKSRLAKSVLTP